MKTTWLITIGNFEFVCSMSFTRGGFRHDCNMVNKYTREYLCHGTKKYQNRTWEEYQFQSVIQECISQASKMIDEKELKRLNWLFERDEKTVVKKMGGLIIT